MTARLERPLKRELLIKGDPYRLTISPLGLHLARKGKRKGCELSWADLVNGNAALATALNASLELHRQAASNGNGRGRHTKKFRYS
jgi:hypothetical protein